MDWEWMEEENKKSFGVVVNEISRWQIHLWGVQSASITPESPLYIFVYQHSVATSTTDR